MHRRTFIKQAFSLVLAPTLPASFQNIAHHPSPYKALSRENSPVESYRFSANHIIGQKKLWASGNFQYFSVQTDQPLFTRSDLQIWLGRNDASLWSQSSLQSGEIARIIPVDNTLHPVILPTRHANDQDFLGRFLPLQTLGYQWKRSLVSSYLIEFQDPYGEFGAVRDTNALVIDGKPIVGRALQRGNIHARARFLVSRMVNGKMRMGVYTRGQVSHYGLKDGAHGTKAIASLIWRDLAPRTPSYLVADQWSHNLHGKHKHNRLRNEHAFWRSPDTLLSPTTVFVSFYDSLNALEGKTALFLIDPWLFSRNSLAAEQLILELAKRYAPGKVPVFGLGDSHFSQSLQAPTSITKRHLQKSTLSRFDPTQRHGMCLLIQR